MTEHTKLTPEREGELRRGHPITAVETMWLFDKLERLQTALTQAEADLNDEIACRDAICRQLQRVIPDFSTGGSPVEWAKTVADEAIKRANAEKQPSSCGELSESEKSALKEVALSCIGLNGSAYAGFFPERLYPYVSRLLSERELLAVAGAYLDAEDELSGAQRHAEPEWNDWIVAAGEELLKRTPADATSALKKAIGEKVAGMREAAAQHIKECQDRMPRWDKTGFTNEQEEVMPSDEQDLRQPSPLIEVESRATNGNAPPETYEQGWIDGQREQKIRLIDILTPLIKPALSSGICADEMLKNCIEIIRGMGDEPPAPRAERKE